MILRFTQTLLKDMNVVPEECAEGSSLFSWHVNIYKLNNRKHIVFVHDLSCLCVIIDGIRARQLKQLKDKFLETLRVYLISEQAEERLIDFYLQKVESIVVAKTNSRSILGTMKEITYFEEDDFEDNISRLKWLNRLIFKATDYNRPIEVFVEALNKEYQGS
jgi:hypothetical protein